MPKTNYMIKNSILFILVVFLLASCNNNNYKLIWSDEFDYSGKPDSTKWDYNIGGHGWGNNEMQYYTDELKNAEVKDGKLIIRALKDTIQGSEYSSARLTTKSKGGHWTYGKIEASLKLPYGQGIWPAFWMLGSNFRDVGWPDCGEIDIMELVGSPERDNTSHGTLHWRNTEGKRSKSGNSYNLDNGIFNDAYHTFAIEWNPEMITWFVDENLIHFVDISQEEFSAFHKDFYILLNLAVGGKWPGYPDSTTVFPQYLEAEYIRVYSKSE
jgi:beta-glucanase (GH16 family)